MTTWADNLIQFYASLQPPQKLPNGIQWLLPLHDPAIQDIQQRFFHKFYNDANPRRLLLGINPGRFGAGITGVNFTGFRQLTHYCGIEHNYKQSSELSAEFIYDVIHSYGGPEAFYASFFISSVCPLGFVKGGKNINYYDDKKLQTIATPFIIKNIKKLLTFNVDTSRCICIGGEKNFRYLSSLNDQHHFFTEIIPVPHPRFVMQYRRRYKDEFIDQYLHALNK